MTDPRWEENAALQALGLLESSEQAELSRAADHDPEVAALVREFSGIASQLAYDAPPMEPPAQLQKRIMDSIGAREDKPSVRILAFPRLFIPYAIAACLLGLLVYQANLIHTLKARLWDERATNLNIAASHAVAPLRDLQLVDLSAVNAAYAKAQAKVVWDSPRQRGIVAVKGLPAPPAGHDYQLWVLDPAAKAPVSARLLATSAPPQDFTPSRPVSATGLGFAISLEPAGGSPTPTPGAVIFAVAPGS